MAMSLKKIGALAVGGAMVATALASGVSAEVTIIGSVTKDIFVKNGQPNCYIVVGANAPSTMDVVSAADIAATIGSLCYKETTVEDGKADISVHVSAKSDDKLLYNGSGYYDKYGNRVFGNATESDKQYALFITAADSDYADDLASNYTVLNSSSDKKILGDIYKINVTYTYSLGDLPTLMKVEDIDPNDWYNNNDDAGEILLVELSNSSGNGEVDLYKKDAAYMVLAYKDGDTKVSNTTISPLKVGEYIPFLGKEKAIVKISTDDDYIALGDPVKVGTLKEGETYELPNGYAVKIAGVYKEVNGNGTKVDVQILKDGKVVYEKTDKTPFSVIYKDVGVIVHAAWSNVAETTGFAEVLIADNVKKIELGKEYIPDWKAYAVVWDSNNETLVLKDDINNDDINKLVGLELQYWGDNQEGLSNGDEIDIAGDYAKFKLDDEGKTNYLYGYFEMDDTQDAELSIGQKVSVLNADITLNNIMASGIKPCLVKTPITKLDTEVSLDNADKNLVLIGGPVANKLTKELIDMGKLENITNNSPPTIAVVKGVANGHDVVVVAGGNREKTREAAEKLMEILTSQ
ncbi:S-layer protein [Methanocaldococcus sp.]